MKKPAKAVAKRAPTRKAKKVTWDDIVRTGPGTLGGRYMRRFWQPICRSEDLAPKRSRRELIMSQWVTLYRGQSGQVYAVADRCPHRGTQLATGWVEGEAIRCFYHGWKFAGSGQCVEQPAEKAGFAAKMRIDSYPVREYLGLVFVYLGEGQAPELPRYPELENDRSGHLIVQSTVPIPCNFFQRVENAVDQVHVAFVHRDVYGAEGMGEVPDYRVEETEYGIRAFGERDNAEDRITHFNMPNINLLLVPPGRNEVAWSPFLTWRVPVDDESYRNFNVRRVYLKPGTPTENLYPDRSQEQVDRAADIIARRIVLEDLDPRDRALTIAVQDNVAQMAQGPIVDRDNDHLGRSDVGVILLRKIWRDDVQALADGKPMRRWRRPAGGVIMQSGAPRQAAE